MKAFIKLIALAGILLLGGWLCTAVLPLIAPFLLSFGAAAVMEPCVSALQRRGVGRTPAAGIVTVMTLSVCGGLVGLCAAGAARLVTSYARQTPRLLLSLSDTADALQERMLVLLEGVPEGVEQELLTAAEGLSARLSGIPVRLSEMALDGLTRFAKQSPDGMLFLCTAIIGVYFFSLYFREIRAFFRRQLSEEAARKLRLIRRVTLGAAAGYLKVQCIISGVTFAILLGAFRLMGIEGSFAAAAGIAVVDALPILGSGAVLLPWAVIAMVTGKAARGVLLVLIYALLLVVHNLLQAKLMGSHLGLHPVAALVSLYVGWKLAGLGGMILLPVVCVLLTALNDAGILQLYR